MRDILSDIVKHAAPFDVIKVTGKEGSTEFAAMSEDRLMYLQATLNEPSQELIGEFGITNMGLLGGLLNFATYKTEGASFKIKRAKMRDGSETVEQLEFSDDTGKAKSVFRCMSPDRVPTQPEIRQIPWDIDVPTTKSSVAEFSALNSLYGAVDKVFSAKVDDGHLVFSIGDEGSSTHRGSMVFAKGIDGRVTGDPVWTTSQLLTCLKIVGDREGHLKISPRGVLGVTVASPFATYSYLIRASARGA